MFENKQSLWPVKFLAVAGGFGALLFLPDPALFGVYAEVARVLSLVWMLFQVSKVMTVLEMQKKQEQHDPVINPGLLCRVRCVS